MATETFWVKGYEATSIRDLVESTKLNTRSMYKLFGSKDELFVEIVKRYKEKVFLEVCEPLIYQTGEIAILGFIQNASNFYNHHNGCLMLNTLCEKNIAPKEAIDIVESFLNLIELNLAKRIDELRIQRDLEISPTEVAAELVIYFAGLVSLSKLSGFSFQDKLKLILKKLN